MSNDNAQNTPDHRPAVGGPVERMVRLGAEAPTLVERLRARFAAPACNADGTYTVGNCPPDALCQEAATELERLRAALEVSQAAIDAARMAGVRSVQEQTAVIVRAALELLEGIEGETPFTAEAVRAFKRAFGA
jgi:hypothetical protein